MNTSARELSPSVSGSHAGARLNTDREIWRETEGDFYSPSVFVTVGGGIGINVGGYVSVAQPKTWLGFAIANEGLRAALQRIADGTYPPPRSETEECPHGVRLSDDCIDCIAAFAALSVSESRDASQVPGPTT